MLTLLNFLFRKHTLSTKKKGQRSCERLTGRLPSDWDLVIQVGDGEEEGRGRGKAAGPISPVGRRGRVAPAGNADCWCRCCRPPLKMSLGINYHCIFEQDIESRGSRGVTKRYVVYLSAPIAPSFSEPKCGGRGGAAGSQPLSTALDPEADPDPASHSNVDPDPQHCL